MEVKFTTDIEKTEDGKGGHFYTASVFNGAKLEIFFSDTNLYFIAAGGSNNNLESIIKKAIYSKRKELSDSHISVLIRYKVDEWKLYADGLFIYVTILNCEVDC